MCGYKKDRSHHNAAFKAFEFLQCQEKKISKLSNRKNYRQNSEEEKTLHIQGRFLKDSILFSLVYSNQF